MWEIKIDTRWGKLLKGTLNGIKGLVQECVVFFISTASQYPHECLLHNYM